MPSATYCFLIDTRELVGESSLDLLASPDQEFEQHINRVFEPWNNEVCRPSGVYWHTHEALILSNGRVVQLVEEGDWLGRDGIVHEWQNDDAAVSTLVSMTNEDQWLWLDKVILYAWRCAASGVVRNDPELESGVPRDVDSMSLEELQLFFWSFLPARIGAKYTLESEYGVPDIAFDYNLDVEDIQHRIRLVEAYEAFRSSILKPFSIRRRKPELYRCFDIRGCPETVESPANVGILLSDVHVP